ncbi:MAG: hypothetical protein LBB12_04600 [Holosporaceae bacterium]|jgi:hypothetical protein|nr:hypothetical protein [Holosporaceae bacterium]
MYKKMLCRSIFLLWLSGIVYVNNSYTIENNSGTCASKGSSEASDASIDGTPQFDGFINIRFAHERKNDNALGPKNTSAVAFTPVVTVGNVTLESDFYYGHQFTYSSIPSSERHLSKMTSKKHEFRNAFKSIKTAAVSGMAKNINNAHFYRSYSRAFYKNEKLDFCAVLGDVSSKSVIGYQQSISGAGISIFRQKGGGMNNGSGITLVRPSKIECKLGNEILALRVFAPGGYSLEDLPEEVKIPGVYLKVSDSLNKSEKFNVDYFGGYGYLEKGKDDFDFIIACRNRWDIDDPYRIRYTKKPRYGLNYRYGVEDDITLGTGAQLFENSYLFDIVAIFVTKSGLISPNISFSRQDWGNGNNANAIGAGLFYKLPEKDTGLSLEVFLGVKSRGFGDFGKSKYDIEEYNKFMDKYFNEPLQKTFKDSPSESSSTREVIVRMYTQPICGVVTPTFTFNGVWGKSQRLREYTFSLVTRVFDYFTLVTSAGLTYDDPSGGSNHQSPDRRLTVACTIPLGEDFSVGGSYYHHDDERLRNYVGINYTPIQIKGLEFSAEQYTFPGFSNPCFALKYDGDYFNVKLEEKINNVYENSGNNARHDNQQRAFFGTSITTKGIKSYRKSFFNVLRTAPESIDDTK